MVCLTSLVEHWVYLCRITGTKSERLSLHGKNSFVKVSKSLTKYRFENKLCWTIKIIM